MWFSAWSHAVDSLLCFFPSASVDSASLMVSEVADPDQTCSSEDLCSLEVQGSDSSPYGTLHTAPTDGSCTSLELCTRDPSRCHRGVIHIDVRPSDTGYSESSQTQESLERSPDWSSENYSNLDQEDSADNSHPCEELSAAVHICDELASAKHLPEEPPKPSPHSLIKARMMSRKLMLPVTVPPPPQPCSPTSVASSGGTSANSPVAPSPSPPNRPRGPRLCFSVWSPSSSSQTPSTSAQRGNSPAERPRVLRSTSKYRRLARIVRSTSDPISCFSATGSKCDIHANNSPLKKVNHCLNSSVFMNSEGKFYRRSTWQCLSLYLKSKKINNFLLYSKEWFYLTGLRFLHLHCSRLTLCFMCI